MKVDVAAQKRAKLLGNIKQSRECFKTFVETVWANEPGFQLADFQIKAADAYVKFDEKFMYWEAARGHGKSLITLAFCTWCLGRDTNHKIKLICANDKEARKRLYEIKEQIRKNALLKLVFPALERDPEGEWNKSRIFVKRSDVSKDPSIEAMGVMSGSLGSRATIIIFDDIVDMRNSILQPQLREHVRQKVFGEIVPLLEPENGIIRAVGTPWTLCLPEETPIPTSGGSKPIGTITPNTRIHLGAGKYGRYTHRADRQYNGKLISFRLSGVAGALSVTPEHVLPTARGDITASDLRKDDWVLVGKRPHPHSKRALEQLGPQPIRKQHHQKRLPKSVGVSRKAFIAAVKKHDGAGKAAKALGYTYAYGSTIAAFYDIPCVELGALNVEHFIHNPAFWWLVGLWVAEGTVAHKEAYWYLGKSDDEETLATKTAHVLRTVVGCSARKKRHKGSWCVVASSAVLAKWLSTNFGYDASNKRLAYFCESLPNKHLYALLDGYFDGDGWACDDNTWYEASTVSRELALGIQRTLGCRGLHVSTYKRRRKQPKIGQRKVKHWHPEYTIRLSRSATYALGWSQHRPQPPPTTTFNFLHGEAWRRVTSIKRVPYKGRVVDLTTTTGYFGTETCMVHNCDVNAIMKESDGWYQVGPDRVGEGENGELISIWLYKFKQADLDLLHRILGPAEFARAYRCRALTGATVPIQGQWIKYYDSNVLGDPYTKFCLQCYDLAIGEDREHDYFAWATMLWDKERNYVFVCDVGHAKLTFGSQSKKVVSNAKSWHPQEVVIESGGYQGSLASYLEEDARTMLPIWPFRNRGRSKERRMTEASRWFEYGRVFFHPKLNPQRNPDVHTDGDAIGEITSFPFGKHDDISDAIVMGLLTIVEMDPNALPDEATDEEGFDVQDGVAVRVTLI